MSDELEKAQAAEEQSQAIEQKAEESAVEAPATEEAPVAEEIPAVDYSGMNLSEITEAFGKFMEDPDRMKKSKEAEAIKSAFYKKLGAEKAAAGLTPSEEPAGEEETAEAVSEETPEEKPASQEPANPFATIEAGFKEIYARYRHEKAEYNKQQDELRGENLKTKQAIIEDLKALVEKDGDVSKAFPELRAIQDRWKAAGPVPAQNFRGINQTYQFYIEQFYDKVQINREMRDLDFRKNLEAKTALCEAAEKLSQQEDVVDAFKELQKLHVQWKDLGPVAKEFRESIWDRFKAATTVINKAYQAHFEGLKEQMTDNLAKKTALCEKVEAIADRTDIATSGEWNDLTKQILDIQKEWKTIGFATRKENQNIYDRFRAACDKFFASKKEFYSGMKSEMNANVARKEDLIAQAEALKDSTDWKATAEKFVELQKEWKESGAVPRKKSEQLWTRFRAACDVFFNNRDKNQPRNNYHDNLKAKQALVEEIKNFNTEDKELLRDARANFEQRWKEIGFVPFKDKEKISKAFDEAMAEKFPGWHTRGEGGRLRQAGNRLMTEKDRLVAKFNALQQEIETSENNIGFFAAGKNASALIERMKASIEESKKQLESLKAKIREAEEKESESGETEK